MKRWFHSIMSSAVFLAVFCTNAFYLHSPILGTLTLGWFVFLVMKYGQLPRSSSQPTSAGRWILPWIICSIILGVGATAYYLAFIPSWLFPLLVILTSISLTLANTHETPKPLLSRAASALKKIPSLPILGGALLTTFLIGNTFRLLTIHKITDAVRTPWDRVPIEVLIPFFFATILTAAFLYRGRERKLSFLLFLVVFAGLVCFLALTYPLGYGFDPFIHKATEAHIAEFGTITPKPFYYIGQYALVLFFAQGFSLPLDLVDTWLVPLLTVLLLPAAWLTAAQALVQKPRHAFLCLLGLFLLPLEPFTVTTPQNLAHLWTLLMILMTVPSLAQDLPLPFPIIALSSIAILLIHPVSGIPVLFFAALLWLSQPHAQFSFEKQRALRPFFILFACLALPASFVLQSFQQGNGLKLRPISLSFEWIQTLHLDVFWQNRFSPLLDLVYLYGQTIFFILFGIALYAWFLYRRELSDRMMLLAHMTIILAINYLLLAHVIDFSFLIEYERANYANRLLPLMLFFLSPLVLLGLGHFSMNLRSKPFVLKFLSLILCAITATTAFYLAFPRHDAYTVSRAYNVSQADVDAVYLIEEWANHTPYVVLANQSVSAAAMKHIGFRYYGSTFFYPIPTGEAMYRLFLEMNDGPNLTTVEKVRQMLPANDSVQTVFYVVNTYWWQADQLIEQTKALATDWKNVNGTVYIFRFDPVNHP